MLYYTALGEIAFSRNNGYDTAFDSRCALRLMRYHAVVPASCDPTTGGIISMRQFRRSV